MADNNTPEVEDDAKPTDAVNREHWLELAVNELRPVFKNSGYRIPGKVRVSVGWPSTGGLSEKSRTIGQCWDIDAAADGVAQIFISPMLANSIDVLDVLAHELGHAVLGSKAGHGPRFARFCKAIGLDGKPTRTHAGDTLKRTLVELRDEKLGDYPHAALSGSGRKKQGTRLIKVVCPECGYTIRVTRKWLEVGTPTCPCSGIMEEDYGETGEPRDEESLEPRDHTIEYATGDGRFLVRYVRKVDVRGKSRTTWYVTDFDAAPPDVHIVVGARTVPLWTFPQEARVTTLYTRQDALGFIEAARTGVYRYPKLDERDEPELDPGADFEDDAYIGDDDDEAPDVPEDQTEYEQGIDDYPMPEEVS